MAHHHVLGVKHLVPEIAATAEQSFAPVRMTIPMSHAQDVQQFSNRALKGSLAHLASGKAVDKFSSPDQNEI
jgi:hypothetical protein